MMNSLATGALRYNAQNHATHTQALVKQSDTSDSAELQKVCQDFEALFVKMMLDSMRNTMDDNGLIPKNSGEKLFEDRLYDEYAQKISQTASLGIADMMYNQLSASVFVPSLNIRV